MDKHVYDPVPAPYLRDHLHAQHRLDVQYVDGDDLAIIHRVEHNVRNPGEPALPAGLTYYRLFWPKHTPPWNHERVKSRGSNFYGKEKIIANDGSLVAIVRDAELAERICSAINLKETNE